MSQAPGFRRRVAAAALLRLLEALDDDDELTTVALGVRTAGGEYLSYFAKPWAPDRPLAVYMSAGGELEKLEVPEDPSGLLE